METAYTDERQNKYYELEDSSWWFLHRANLFLLLISSYFDKSAMIYDIGGSNGFYTKYLQDNDYDTTLVEPTIAACKNAQKRGVKNINNSMFQDIDETIPQFCLLDVLEHIEIANLRHQEGLLELC